MTDEGKRIGPLGIEGALRLCGARRRDGEPCRQPAMRGRNRCRMHGGKTPTGPDSPHWRHGRYSVTTAAEREAEAAQRAEDAEVFRKARHAMRVLDRRWRRDDPGDVEDAAEGTRGGACLSDAAGARQPHAEGDDEPVRVVLNVPRADPVPPVALDVLDPDCD